MGEGWRLLFWQGDTPEKPRLGQGSSASSQMCSSQDSALWDRTKAPKVSLYGPDIRVQGGKTTSQG